MHSELDVTCERGRMEPSQHRHGLCSKPMLERPFCGNGFLWFLDNISYYYRTNIDHNAAPTFHTLPHIICCQWQMPTVWEASQGSLSSLLTLLKKHKHWQKTQQTWAN